MGSAVESVDMYCLVEVAGLAVPLQPAEEVELADLRCLAEGARWAGSQRSAEEAGLNTCSMPGPNTPTIICLNTPRKAL
jgi:hypothetical protein